VPVRRLLAAKPNLELRIWNLVAFSSGFAFLLDVEGAEARLHDTHPIEYFEGGSVESVLRFGIELENGRRATNLDRVTGTRRVGVGLETYSTASRPGGRTLSSWAWPLPPGRVILFAWDWRALGFGFTTLELDASAIRAAGQRSRRLRLGPPG